MISTDTTSYQWYAYGNVLLGLVKARLVGTRIGHLLVTVSCLDLIALQGLDRMFLIVMRRGRLINYPCHSGHIA